MRIDWQKTPRGFVVGRFRDRYDSECSVQRSSIAFEDCIWLGLEDPKIMRDDMPSELPRGYVALGRMHLDREAAREMGALLTIFAETGTLNGDESEEESR